MLLYAGLAAGWQDVNDPYKASSYDLYGMVADRNSPPNYDEIMRHGCFTGIGFSHCRLEADAQYAERGFESEMSFAEPYKATSDSDVEPNLQNAPFHIDETLEPGKPFCLKCCSNSRNKRGFLESWKFNCDWKSEADTIDSNLFNKQFRFATRQTLTSLEVTRCEIKRPRERQVIEIVPYDNSALVDPDWKFHLGVWDSASELWKYTAEISVNATAAKEEEYVVTGAIDIGDDGSLPCMNGVDCPGDSIESKLESLFRSLALANSVESEEDEERSDDDWRQPKTGIDGLSGVKVSRGRMSAQGAYTWTVTWPFYQHNVPQLETQVLGSNLSDATINVTTLPNRYLHGYHLILGVMEMSDGLDYWRSATYCNVQIIEGDEPAEEFTEIWSMEFAFSGAVSRFDESFWRWRCLRCCSVILLLLIG